MLAGNPPLSIGNHQQVANPYRMDGGGLFYRSVMEFHEYANIFPMMTGDDYRALRDDIAANGLNEPIWLYEGKIIDGRNRYTACMDLQIEPEYKTLNGGASPIAFVISQNLHRRHLTPGQRAFAALEVKRIYAELAKKNQGKRTDLEEKMPDFFQVIEKSNEQINATKEAATQFGVNTDYVSAATQMTEHAPDIAEKVKSGKMTMNRAKTEYKQRQKKERVKQYTEETKAAPPAQKIYNVIYADPPWQYSKTINDLDATTDHHYSTLNIEQVKSYLEDNGIKLQDDAVLFLWVTNPFVKKALDVVSAWGFEYKSNIVWVKTELKKPGIGYYVRGRHELLFICTRGSFTPLDKNISPPIGSVLESPVGKHSAKPKEVYEVIERLYPDCTYLEIFARCRRDNWDAIGDDA